jgi:PmbA protein
LQYREARSIGPVSNLREIAYPVHEMTIAGNLREMYQGIQSIATDVDCRGGIRSGSLLIDQVTLAGN